MTIMERYSGPVAYAGSGTALLFGFTLSDVGAMVGILVAVATFGLNWWYKRKALRILEAKQVINTDDLNG